MAHQDLRRDRRRAVALTGDEDRSPRWLVLLSLFGVAVALAITLHPSRVMVQGDPSTVYLPFARYLADGRLADALGILTSLGRMPLYALQTGVVVALFGPDSLAVTGVNVLLVTAALALWVSTLRAVGLGRGAWVAVLLVGLHPVVIDFTSLCLPDALLLLIYAAFVRGLTSMLQGGEGSAKLGGWAALGLLARFNPFGFVLAYHVVEWTSRQGRPLKARIRRAGPFYLSFGAAVATTWAAIAAVVWFGHRLVYPIIYFPKSQLPDAASAGHPLVGLLVRNVLMRPVDLISMVPLWSAPLAVAGALLVFRGTAAQRGLLAALAAMIASLVFVHFEPRYQTMWLLAWSMSLCAVMQHTLQFLDRWGRAATGAFTAAALVGLTALGATQVQAGIDRLEPYIAGTRYSEETCREIRDMIPAGEVVLLQKANHGTTYRCLFDRRPAYGFTEDTAAHGVRWLVDGRAGDGWPPAALASRTSSVSGRVRRIQPTATATAAWSDVALAGVPVDVSAPSWRFTRARREVPLAAGRHLLRITTEDPEVPLRVRVKVRVAGGGDSPHPDWILPASQTGHVTSVTMPADGHLKLDIGPLAPKWPAGTTRVVAVQTARLER